MVEYCCVPGCKSGAVAPRIAQETKNLFGKIYCNDHLDIARAEANAATEAANKLIPDFGVWETAGFRNENGQANKIIGQVDVWVNVAGLAEGMPKAKAIQCGGFDYEFGMNPAIDAELKVVFDKLKKPENKPVPAKPQNNNGNGNLSKIPAIIPEKPKLSIETIIKNINPELTEQEAYMFLMLCQEQNLNPFVGDVYAIKYDKTAAPAFVVGKGAFMKRADAQPDFQGFKAGIIVLMPDGKGLQEREGTFLMKDEVLLGGWAKVSRKNRNEYSESVSLSEYIKTNKEGKPTKMWATSPGTMIRKVALVHALREAFPSQFTGMYDRSELREVPEE